MPETDQNEIVLQGRYRHYKRGQIYEVIGFAFHSETYEEMVIYKALYDCEKFGSQQVWVRPRDMFLEKVLHEGKWAQRFLRINHESSN